MWRPIPPLTDVQSDTIQFFATLNEHASFFDPSTSLVVARAPGRLDLMGGIADYSGSLVLELPLGVAAFAAAQLTDLPVVTLRSLQAAMLGAHADVTFALSTLAPGGAPIGYAAIQSLLTADKQRAWAAYIVGALVVLGHERGVRIDRGLRLLIDSQVPPGKGVSSSAAIEVASMQAVAALYGVELAGRELALLCQKVENVVVGAPCGIMDQMTSACGEEGKLLALRCQPAELEEPVMLPPDLQVWGIDSGIRHAVSGADYDSVRVGAFMGYRIIADLAGLSVYAEPAGSQRLVIGDPMWNGYLANITPSVWAQHYRERVPEAIGGAAFLECYGGTTDRVTRVDPSRTYAVRAATAHPIEEHHRVRLFRALLLRGAEREMERMLLGELMYQSHASYSACGLGSDGTDRLVELAREIGPSGGLYGAKITGGGSGGTVAVLARRGSEQTIRALAARYEQESGRATMLLHGSSRGAQASGVVWLTAG